MPHKGQVSVSFHYIFKSDTLLETELGYDKYNIISKKGTRTRDNRFRGET